MAEFTNAMLQTVAANANVQLSDEIGCLGEANGIVRAILHREGAGIVILRGLGNRCYARYKVTFGGNIQIPTGGTVGAISIALALGGEPLAASTAIVTPAAVENLWNVAVFAYVDVPHGCCVSASVRNVSDQAIEVQNANLIVERVA